MSRISNAVSVLLCMVISQHIGATSPSGIGAQLTPDAIISHARLDLLADEPYRHPVHPDPVEGESYLELRKWDLVFTGPLPGHSSNINNIIPGRYDHTIAYVGKDASGYAYFVELTQSSLANSEPIKLFSPGKDFGEDRHPSGDRFWSDFFREYRWAKTFRDEIRVQVLAHDKALTAQVMQDLREGLLYEIPARYPDNPLADRRVILVDDGPVGGSTCTDYWTYLFEQQANVCFYGVRMTGEELFDYVLNDPEGRKAYVPDEVNPLPFRLNGRDLLNMGFRVEEDEPHHFRCGGEPESGMVLADLLIDNPYLLDPPEALAPLDARHLVDTIEYHHAGLDRYLLTNETEAAMIDTGSAGSGWVRTGFAFKAWSKPGGNAVAVSRFHVASAKSHFLTADRGERDQLRALNPSTPSDPEAWALEGISFYILAPQDGSCPSETTAVHRLFDGSPVTGPRHRYTTRLDIIDTMTRQGWTHEGVAMCAPNL